MSELLDKLDRLYQDANSLDEQIPSDLARKIVLFAEVLRILGILIAQSTYRYKKIENERKRIYAQALISEIGTSKEKEGKAELKVASLRKQEAYQESELIKWRNVYDATKELINAYKKQLDVLLLEWGKPNE